MGPRIFYLSTFGLEFENDIVIFEISNLDFLQSANFCEETNTPKFGIKNALFAYFRVRTFKNYCHNRNQHLRICLIVKFREEIKMPKFRTKNALFGCFRGRIKKKTFVRFEIITLEFV